MPFSETCDVMKSKILSSFAISVGFHVSSTTGYLRTDSRMCVSLDVIYSLLLISNVLFDSKYKAGYSISIKL